MKKLRKIGLLVALISLLNLGQSHAATKQEIILNVDTSRYTNTIKRCNDYLEKNPGISKKERQDLENLVKKMESLVRKIEAYQKSHNENDFIKNEIRKHLNNRSTYFSVDINRHMTNEYLSDLFLQVAKEDPYFFYSQYGACKISTSSNEGKAKDGKKFIEKANFDITYRSSLDQDQQVRNFIDQWVSENISENQSDYGKVLAIHDFIVKKNFYNRGDSKSMSGGYSIYNPSSIIYGNGGVCNAYATLFDLMAKKAGLKTYYMTGKSTRNGEDHMWNMVNIFGQWYHIDTTWDDPVVNFSAGHIENLGDFVIYDYFLKSDDQIKKSRTIDEDGKRPSAPNSYTVLNNNSKIEMIDGKYWIIND
uniref:transglutaminase domain-containing protein n=1 Tax=Anaerococcus mediterraneensis TaxID=1870984 RepID=UPI00092FF3DB|nr:transglutaminase domain-containing protein [Anaerococcus mediterraneensis]